MDKGFSDSTSPDSPKQARQILSEIQKQEERKWEETPEEAKDELRGLREVTSDTLDNPTHVIPELLQNADDIGDECSKVTIRLEDDMFVFQNHKEPMEAQNVEALGAFTKSTKRGNLESIGHFGIGFKTSFSLTDAPYIHSGYFSFRYQEDDPTVPEIVEYSDQPATNGEYFDGTTIALPFTEEAKTERRDILAEQLRDIGSLIPFLNNINTAIVSVDGEQNTYYRKAVGKDEFEITRERAGEETNSKRIRLFSESFSPGKQLLIQLAQKRHLDAEALRERDPTLDITLAIPIDETGAPTAQDESHIFSYFPTEPNTHLPFNIQADFSLKPDRRSIRWPDEFNKQLINHVPTVFENAFVQLHKEQVDPSRILELIPDPTIDRSQTQYLEPAVDDIISFVRSESCIPDQEGNLFQPAELVFLDQPFRHLLTEKEASTVLGRPVRYPSEHISKTARKRLRTIVPEGHIDVDTLLDSCSDASIFQSKSETWLIQFMAGVMRYWNSNYDTGGSFIVNSEDRKARNEFLARLKAVPLLPLEEDDLTSYTEKKGQIYRLGIGYADDYQLFTDADSLHLLSGELVSMLNNPNDELSREASLAEDLLFDDELLGIPELEPADIVREVINPAFDNESIDRKRADQFTLFVARRPRTVGDIADIKLQTDSTDDFRSPEQLFLGSNYIDTYDTATVFAPFEGLTAISDHYLELGELSKPEWTEALAELGVSRRIEVIDQDPWESARFTSEDEVHKFLDEHGDQGRTELHDEQYLSGYNGRKSKWGWMKRENRHGSTKNYKYALIDRFLPGEFREKLESLAGKEQSTDTVEYWSEFLKMLDEEWESYYQDKVYRVYKYSEYSGMYRVQEGECYCPSSFGTFLLKTIWAPGTDDALHKPRDLFVRNKLTEDKPVVFIEPEPEAAELIEFLELQQSPGIQVTISTLQQIIDRYQKTATETDPDEIERAIRKQLYAVDEELLNNSLEGTPAGSEAVNRLQKMAFIYVQDANPAFREPSQVTWSGPSLGEYLVPVSEVYSDFRTLFSELGVQSEPELKDYIEFLGEGELETQGQSETNQSPWNDFETAWQQVLQNVIYLPREQVDQSNNQLDEAIELLKNDGCIPTAAETLVPREDVQFHSTDLTLLSNLPLSIQSQVLSPWRDRRYEDGIYTKRLEHLTDTQPLESALNQQLRTDVPKDSLEGTLASEYPQLLNVTYSFLSSSDAATQEDVLKDMAKFELYRVETLKCRYYLDNQHEATSREVPCFADPDQRRIVLSANSRSEFALIDTITRELQLNQTNRSQLVSLLKGALGKPDSLVRAYLNDSDYEYSALRTENENGQVRKSDPEKQSNSKEEKQAPTSDGDSGSESTQMDTSQTLGEATLESTVEQQISKNEGLTSAPKDKRGKSNTSPPVPDRNGTHQSISDSNREGSEKTNEEDAEPDSSLDHSNGTSITDSRFPPSGGGRGGGGGTQQQNIGDEGEAFVFDELLETVKEYFRTEGELKELEVDDSTQQATIKGEHDNVDKTVEIIDVSTQNLGYDLLLKGATLSQVSDELAIEDINPEGWVFVEVKTTKDESCTFTLTPNEYNTATNWSKEYVIVRIHKGLTDSPIVHRLFHTIPNLYEETESTEYWPDGLQIHYQEEG